MTKPTYEPTVEEVRGTQLTRFARSCEARTGARFLDHAALHAWSVREPRAFWRALIEWLDLDVEGSLEPVRVGDGVEDAVFFPELRLSYVANLLRCRTALDAARPAISALAADGGCVRLTRDELAARVLATAAGLRARGIGPGDRVVAVARNTADTAIACLAVASLGATWSSSAPDLGVDALLGRFGQLAPTALFYHAHRREDGRLVDTRDRIDRLVAALPSLALTIDLDDLASIEASAPDGAIASVADLPRFPFNHPLYILFSSGTTGVPKCIVHGAGGTLLEHQKEHRLHGDLRPGDKLYFQTTCGWMMYNWQLSALACGAEIVLYDGALGFPHAGAQWELVARERVTVFGTNPAYLQLTRDLGVVPRERVDLSALRAVQSTGSVLPAALFEWVSEHVKRVPLQSISGGTDIIGCFLLGNPNLPVYPGELQSVSLGLDVAAVPSGVVRAVDADVVATGELVCRNPFPSRPVGFFGDDGTRFHDAYFRQNPGMWTHGDLIELTARGSGRVLGRSDGILNVNGIRIGPAEIYAALSGVPEIIAAMVVEQRIAAPPGSRLVLLVVLDDRATLDHALVARISREIRERCSQAHVPAVIADVPELPMTFNGKRSERAARDAVNGDPVANLAALANPRALDAIRAHPALRVARGEVAAPTEGDPVQREVTRIWQEILGVAVGPDDNFFDIGGDSLRALYLVDAIEKRFAIRLSMASLLGSATTVVKMARQIEAASEDPSPCEVVALKPSGRGRPVYWIPGGGGLSVLAFRDVSLRMGDRPVYGLEARVHTEPAPDVPSLAREYVKAIRAIDPVGPYTLLGFSSGSYTAYEMALQLRDLGADVWLGLFDAPLPVKHTPLQSLRVVAQRSRYHARQVATLPPRAILPYLRSTASLVIKRARERLFPHDAIGWRHEVQQRSSGEQTAFDRRDKHNRRILAQYRVGPLRPYDGAITLFLAERTSMSGVSRELDPRMAWRALAPIAEVVSVAGSHLSMLEPPGVDALAAQIRRCLDAIDASDRDGELTVHDTHERPAIAADAPVAKRRSS